MYRSLEGCLVLEATDNIDTIFQQFPSDCVVGFDVETRNPTNPKAKVPKAWSDELVGVGVSMYEDTDDPDATPIDTVYGLATEPYLDVLRRFLKDRGWYAHNAMFDAIKARRHGIILGPHRGDPRIEAYILGEPEAALKPLLITYLGLNTKDFDVLLEEHGAQDISEVPLTFQADYCGSQDAQMVVPLERMMRRDIAERLPRALEVYDQIELPMVQILVEMTYHGFKFNREEAQKRLDQIANEDGTGRRQKLDVVIAQMVKESGFVEYERRNGEIWHPTCKVCHNGKKKKLSCEACQGRGKLDPVQKVFNPGSWQQRQAFLYDHLGIPMRRFSGGVKQWQIDRGLVDTDELEGSTDALAMLQVKDRHPVIPLMLVRGKESKHEGFLKQWLRFSEEDNRLHPMFNNTKAATGRLSSFDPNSQQVELQYRDLFEADDDEVVVAGDENQLELTIMAYMSKDPVMCEAIKNAWNLHAITAEAVYKIPWRDVSKQSPMYLSSKVANFLTAFGGGIDKLQEGIEKLALEKPELGLIIPSKDECRRILKAHRLKYSVYWEYTRWVVAFCREHGYAETGFGRPRFFDDINSGNDEYRSAAERGAINLTIQGTASDLLKMIQVNIDNDPQMREWGRMVLQVHDEIVCLVKRPYAERYAERLKTHMELGQVFEPIVPLRAEVGIGDTWQATHK